METKQSKLSRRKWANTFNLIIFALVMSYAGIEGCKVNKSDREFKHKIIADAIMYVSFNDADASGQQNVQLYFKFSNKAIVEYRPNVLRFSKTSAFDNRFVEIEERSIEEGSDDNLQLSAPTVSAASTAEDMASKLTISFDNIEGFKYPKDSLKGNVILSESEMADPNDISKMKMVNHEYNATFYIIFNPNENYQQPNNDSPSVTTNVETNSSFRLSGNPLLSVTNEPERASDTIIHGVLQKLSISNTIWDKMFEVYKKRKLSWATEKKEYLYSVNKYKDGYEIVEGDGASMVFDFDSQGNFMGSHMVGDN